MRHVSAGFVTWAYLSHECAQGLKDGTRKLDAMDWRSGDQFWLIDVVAPFGGVWSMVSDMRRLHAGYNIGTAFALRRHRDGTIRKLVQLYDRAGAPGNRPRDKRL
jgi:hemolysin-activating ACP:hemolysin acyltransferase